MYLSQDLIKNSRARKCNFFKLKKSYLEANIEHKVKLPLNLDQRLFLIILQDYVRLGQIYIKRGI